MLSRHRSILKGEEEGGEFVLVVSGQLSVGSKGWSKEKLLAKIKKEIGEQKICQGCFIGTRWAFRLEETQCVSA